MNPGPTGAGALIFRVGMNKTPTKPPEAVFLNSTKYHGEIDAILLALKHIISGQSQFGANAIHIFSDSVAAVNPIANPSSHEIHHDKIKGIIHIAVIH